MGSVGSVGSVFGDGVNEAVSSSSSLSTNGSKLLVFGKRSNVRFTLDLLVIVVFIVTL